MLTTRPYTMLDMHGQDCCVAYQQCLRAKCQDNFHTVELLGKQEAPFVWPIVAMYVVRI